MADSPYPGIKVWETPQATIFRLHYDADPAKGLGEKTYVEDQKLWLSPWAFKEYTEMNDKEIYKQEYEIDFEATQGAKVFYMEDEATLVTSGQLAAQGLWPLPDGTDWYGVDPHPRVPHAHLWCRADRWGDRWYFREFWPSKIYGKDGNLPEDDNRVKIKEHVSVVHWLEGPENPENKGKREEIYRRVIDYSARAFGQGTVDDEPQLNFQERYEKESRLVGRDDSWWMHFVDCVKDHDAGISLVNDGLRPREVEENGHWVKRSKIHIVSDKCPELVLQLKTNRYPKLTPLQADVKDPVSIPLKKRNHMTDLLRYIEMDEPRYIVPRKVKDTWKPLHSGVAY